MASKKQINAADLVNEIVTLGYRRTTAENIVDTVFSRIMDELRAGRKVVISGFGTFEAKRRAKRIARNPRTNEPIVLPERTMPVFTPARLFKDMMGDSNG